MLRRAIDRGEVSEKRLTPRIVRLPVDLVRLEMMMTHTGVSGAAIEEILDQVFLPLVKHIHRWSDRRQMVEVPLFPGYGFVRLSESPACRLRVLQTVGVTGFVMSNGVPVPVPEQQLEDVRRLLASEIAYHAYPFLKTGQRVRIRGGCLGGLEGILLSENKDHSLVISIEAIQRSLVVGIDGYDVEAA